MTSVETRPRTTGQHSGTEPVSARLRRAVPLFVGAAAVLVLLEPIGGLPLRGWVPVLIGLSYITAGLLSGRRGLLLGPGLVLASWGLAPMTVEYAGEEFPGMFYLTLGSGLFVAALLAQRGWYRITPMSLAIPVLFIGGTMYVAQYAKDALTTVLAVLLVAWGLFELRSQRLDDEGVATVRT